MWEMNWWEWLITVVFFLGMIGWLFYLVVFIAVMLGRARDTLKRLL